MNKDRDNSSPDQNSITRLGRIADIIFALAMAQCFFAVDFPVTIQHPTDFEAISFLVSQIKPLISYGFAFVIVGFYWIDNINQFKNYKKTDPVHSSFYLLYLMGMFLIPYSDTLVIYFPNSAIVKICFSINTAFIGLMSFINWNYATQKYRLVNQDISDATISETSRKILIEPLFSLLTIGVAIIDQSWWEFVWFLLPIPYLWSDIYRFLKIVFFLAESILVWQFTGFLKIVFFLAESILVWQFTGFLKFIYLFFLKFIYLFI